MASNGAKGKRPDTIGAVSSGSISYGEGTPGRPSREKRELSPVTESGRVSQKRKTQSENFLAYIISPSPGNTTHERTVTDLLAGLKIVPILKNVGSSLWLRGLKILLREDEYFRLGARGHLLSNVNGSSVAHGLPPGRPELVDGQSPSVALSRESAPECEALDAEGYEDFEFSIVEMSGAEAQALEELALARCREKNPEGDEYDEYSIGEMSEAEAQTLEEEALTRYREKNPEGEDSDEYSVIEMSGLEAQEQEDLAWTYHRENNLESGLSPTLEATSVGDNVVDDKLVDGETLIGDDNVDKELGGEKDRIDEYITNVEDDGNEFLIDGEFVEDDNDLDTEVAKAGDQWFGPNEMPVAAALEGTLKFQPKALNKALPVRQGFRGNVRVYRECESCVNTSANCSIGFFTSQYTKKTLCRNCLRKEQTDRMRPELQDMGMTHIQKLPENRGLCQNPLCESGRPKVFGKSTLSDMLVCQSCRAKETWKTQADLRKEFLGKEDTVAEEVDKVCVGIGCRDRTQKKKKEVKWTRSLVHMVEGREAWLCAPCRSKERDSVKGQKAHETLTERFWAGEHVPNWQKPVIPDRLRYCQDPDCRSKKGKKLAPKNARWSKDPKRCNWVLCMTCVGRENTRLEREALAAKGEAVDLRGTNISEAEKFCTQDGWLPRPRTGGFQGQDEVWHPLKEQNGRVLCQACLKAEKQKAMTEANSRAREKADNPVRKRQS
ncbi:hypothetical protein CEP54_001649 [Fusarium duplospermum]|uniref:Uncharacterized protein n=1 Tax=Fusarium duplospermum TaxID=1325734 RepID=A0A428QZM2_9HYPO|nr:hypothetical protein CEP54_001649 [Fusarium duplospermum]